ncbi:MAG TPA: adenylate/guanylate cyclase domain-containing protein [Chloroflexi bacterium]|nr:adenylate/guanylate cyclase domain-containing protein [Chloroflexota bacterium]
MNQLWFAGQDIPATLFWSWRGQPLYIIYIYLRGQLTLTLPIFLGAMLFGQIITPIVWYDLVGVVSLVVSFVTAMAYLFYHRYSPHIRAFLSTLIAGEPPDRELATKAWIEAVNYPARVVGWTMLVAILAYTTQALYFFLFTQFGLALILQGWIVSLSSTVAIALVFFVFYLERMMYPISSLALAAGARANLTDHRIVHFRLRVKLLVLILPILIVPLVTLGLFGYSQIVRLGADPTNSLLLTGAITSFISVVGVTLALQLVRSVLVPVQELERVIEAVANGDLEARVQPYTSDELAVLGQHFNTMAKRLAEQEQLKTAFGRYVSGTVRDGILNGQISLGGERREITIVFTDIRDFTAWCERTSPEDIIQTLNAYYENLVQILMDHGGTVTRYTGDGVLVLFGAPLNDPYHALHAVEAALKAQEILNNFNAIRHTVNAFELRTGFGIHTGTAVVGSIGYEARAEYTPIGDPANVASRIEDLNRELGTSILISRATYERIAAHITIGKTAETHVKGRVKPVQVYEVLGLSASQ